ncbi:MAG: AAA family ATPase [Nanoarchaeota archaeon]|nr:AAA family ATPase [Nanoarchaeota archaeon]
MDLFSFGVDVKKEQAPAEIINSDLSIDMGELKQTHKHEHIERFLPWFIKYQLEDITSLPKTSAIKKIDEFFKSKDTKKSILLVGSPGCGKTSTLNAYAKYYNLEIVELNASDVRSKKSIIEFLSEILRSKSLFNQEKLILIDEADGISGTYDRGGVNEIISMMKTSKFKFVFTANKKESNQVKALKKVASIIDFEEHTKELHVSIAKRIFEKEGITYDEEVLKNFIEYHKSSDIRGFINDIQAHSSINNEFKPSDVFEKRSYKAKIEELVFDIFNSKSAKEALEKSSYQDVLIDDIILYLEENIIQLNPNVRLKAFLELSKADVYKRRIYKWQYWRYLVYIYFYSSYAINTHAQDNSTTITKIEQNQRLLKSWIFGSKVLSLKNRTKLQKDKEEEMTPVEEFAGLIHRSYKKTRKEDLVYLHLFLQDDKLCEDLEERGILNDKIRSSLEYCFS